MGENNVVITEAAPVLCQVLFHKDEPLFSPAIPTNYVGGTAPPAGAKTVTPKSDTQTDIGGGKSNSNCALPTEGLGVE